MYLRGHLTSMTKSLQKLEEQSSTQPLAGECASKHVVQTYLHKSTKWAATAFEVLTIMEAQIPKTVEMSGLVLVVSHVGCPMYR